MFSPIHFISTKCLELLVFLLLKMGLFFSLKLLATIFFFIVKRTPEYFVFFLFCWMTHTASEIWYWVMCSMQIKKEAEKRARHASYNRDNFRNEKKLFVKVIQTRERRWFFLAAYILFPVDASTFDMHATTIKLDACKWIYGLTDILSFDHHHHHC